jgi:hypothetical protein
MDGCADGGQHQFTRPMEFFDSLSSNHSCHSLTQRMFHIDNEQTNKQANKHCAYLEGTEAVLNAPCTA